MASLLATERWRHLEHPHRMWRWRIFELGTLLWALRGSVGSWPHISPWNPTGCMPAIAWRCSVKDGAGTRPVGTAHWDTALHPSLRLHAFRPLGNTLLCHRIDLAAALFGTE